jgi:membrane-associated phospholipid phosphatase
MIFALIARLRPAPLLAASQQVLFGWAGALLVAGDAVFWLMFAAIQSDSGLAAMDGPVHSLMVDSRNPAATVLLAALTTVTSPEVLTVFGAAFALAWVVWKRELLAPVVLMGAMVLAVVLTTLIKQLSAGPARRRRISCSARTMRSRSPRVTRWESGCSRWCSPTSSCHGSGTRTTTVLGFSAAFAVTALVGLSRLYLGYHWLTDVVASLGVALAVAAVAVFTDAARHGSV